MVCCGNISLSRTFVSTSKKIIKETSSWQNPREVKENSLINFLKTNGKKVQSIFHFLHTKLGSRPNSAQRQYCITVIIPRMVAFTREDLTEQQILLCGRLELHRSAELSFLTHKEFKTFSLKPHSHVKVVFIDAVYLLQD